MKDNTHYGRTTVPVAGAAGVVLQAINADLIVERAGEPPISSPHLPRTSQLFLKVFAHGREVARSWMEWCRYR